MTFACVLLSLWLLASIDEIWVCGAVWWKKYPFVCCVPTLTTFKHLSLRVSLLITWAGSKERFEISSRIVTTGKSPDLHRFCFSGHTKNFRNGKRLKFNLFCGYDHDPTITLEKCGQIWKWKSRSTTIPHVLLAQVMRTQLLSGKNLLIFPQTHSKTHTHNAHPYFWCWNFGLMGAHCKWVITADNPCSFMAFILMVHPSRIEMMTLMTWAQTRFWRFVRIGRSNNRLNIFGKENL